MAPSDTPTTRPPAPDPFEAYVARIETKIDAFTMRVGDLIEIAHKCFDGIEDLRATARNHESRMRSLEVRAGFRGPLTLLPPPLDGE